MALTNNSAAIKAQAITMFRAGLEPSRIDRKMVLDKGTAREIIVRWWREEKLAAWHEQQRAREALRRRLGEQA